MITYSTRVRLARNIKNIPFPGRMNRQQADKVIELVWNCLQGLKIDGGLELLTMDDTSELERFSLVEEHLISPNLAGNTQSGAVLISKNRNVSIMLNEEDHVRIQVILKGQQINEAYDLAQQIDKVLEAIGYSASQKRGYLTSCPTNTGTGLRVSTMLHLPAIIKTGNLNQTIASCNKLGIAVRGLYGENSEAMGDMVQVSNQVTLGQTEEELCVLVERVSKQVADFERQLRGRMIQGARASVEDTIYRSYGILANARILSAKEAIGALSNVRAGIQMGILQTVSMSVVDQLELLIQPASLQRYAGHQMSAEERDLVRANIVREKLV